MLSGDTLSVPVGAKAVLVSAPAGAAVAEGTLRWTAASNDVVVIAERFVLEEVDACGSLVVTEIRVHVTAACACENGGKCLNLLVSNRISRYRYLLANLIGISV